MKKVKMKDDVYNSLLGFGCMRFPTKHSKIDRVLSSEMLDYAFSQGLTHFDTAYPYHGGESESFMGEYLKKHDRSTFTVSTKSPVWKINEFADFEKYLDEQLEKLQLDYVDFYLLHALNKNTWRNIVKLGVFKFLEQAKASGKVRYVGFSYHDDKRTFTEIAEAYPWEFCLLQINYIDYTTQQGMEGYDLLTKKGIPVWVMEPLKGGRLATIAPDIMEKLKAINPNDSAAKWAFRWVHSLENVKLILSGMSTLEQVAENCDMFKEITPLNPQEMSAIDEVREVINNRVKIPCNLCGYCVPCPIDINIPKNFEIYNDAYMYNNKLRAMDSYNFVLKEEQKAPQCIMCNECIDKCPQNINIPEFLREVAHYFE